jgi:hypothetical protein
VQMCKEKKYELRLVEMLYMAEQIAKGMGHMETQGWIHMDLAGFSARLHRLLLWFCRCAAPFVAVVVLLCCTTCCTKVSLCCPARRGLGCWRAMLHKLETDDAFRMFERQPLVVIVWATGRTERARRLWIGVQSVRLWVGDRFCSEPQALLCLPCLLPCATPH